MCAVYLALAAEAIAKGATDPSMFEQALRFSAGANHQEFAPGVEYICADRDTTQEQASDFACGGWAQDRAAIKCSTYWVIGGRRVRCSVEKFYDYWCDVHRGTIQDCALARIGASAVDWLTGAPLEADEETTRLIHTYTGILATSLHDHAFDYAAACAEAFPSICKKENVKELAKVLQRLQEDAPDLAGPLALAFDH